MSTTPPEASNSLDLPEYDDELSLYHDAFEEELGAAVRSLSLPPGATVLDIPCGDGFYTRYLAHAVGPHGTVTGADLRPAYLRRSRSLAQRTPEAERLDFVHANAYRLPFDDATFDCVWCAQSFISLAAPQAALREFLRVLKPSGIVAVLETDEFHHIVLPWPAPLELRLQEAVQAACHERYGNPGKTYVSRHLRGWMQAAGCTSIERTSFTADRQSPLAPKTIRFLEVHLAALAKTIGPFLNEADRSLLDQLTAAESPDFLLHREDFECTCLFSVWQGKRGA